VSFFIHQARRARSEGISIANRTFRFLDSSSSQTRTGGFWAIAERRLPIKPLLSSSLAPSITMTIDTFSSLPTETFENEIIKKYSNHKNFVDFPKELIRLIVLDEYIPFENILGQPQVCDDDREKRSRTVEKKWNERFGTYLWFLEVKSRKEWEECWKIYQKAKQTVFPTLREPLKKYETYIMGLFDKAEKDEHLRNSIIVLEKSMRSQISFMRCLTIEDFGHWIFRDLKFRCLKMLSLETRLHPGDDFTKESVRNMLGEFDLSQTIAK
jgi:hypothetical protein